MARRAAICGADHALATTGIDGRARTGKAVGTLIALASQLNRPSWSDTGSRPIVTFKN